MCMVTMQYPLNIPHNIRSNIDYVFLFRENNMNIRKRIYEQFAGMFTSFETFCQAMDQYTKNHDCLVVQINASCNKLDDQVYWYRADIHDSFKVAARGCASG